APAGADGSEGVPPRHEDGIGAPVRGAVAELAEAVLPPAPGLVALERAHVAASGLDRRERPAFRDPLRLGGLALVPDDQRAAAPAPGVPLLVQRAGEAVSHGAVDDLLFARGAAHRISVRAP